MQNCDRKHIFRIRVQEMLRTHPDREKYGYLQGDQFTPHEWVYDAMELAYQIGLKNANFTGVF